MIKKEKCDECAYIVTNDAIIKNIFPLNMLLEDVEIVDVEFTCKICMGL